jgi:hypothetical protein
VIEAGKITGELVTETGPELLVKVELDRSA